jgi:queuine/archaeosine tRNA-ribosyltransferase
MLLRVTNRNSFTLKDKFDGVEYVFEPNKATVMEEDAARHIFGYGSPNKIPYLVRQGWCPSSDKTEEAMKKLNKFIFEEGKMQFESTDEEDSKEHENPDENLNEIANKIVMKKHDRKPAIETV